MQAQRRSCHVKPLSATIGGWNHPFKDSASHLKSSITLSGSTLGSRSDPEPVPSQPVPFQSSSPSTPPGPSLLRLESGDMRRMRDCGNSRRLWENLGLVPFPGPCLPGRGLASRNERSKKHEPALCISCHLQGRPPSSERSEANLCIIRASGRQPPIRQPRRKRNQSQQGTSIKISITK